MLSKDLSLWWNLAQGTTRLPVLKHVLDGTVFWSCGERHDKQDGRERCMGIEEDLGSVPGVCVWEEPGRIGSRRSWERHGVMIYFCSGKTGLGGADVQHAQASYSSERLQSMPDLSWAGHSHIPNARRPGSPKVHTGGEFTHPSRFGTTCWPEWRLHYWGL